MAHLLNETEQETIQAEGEEAAAPVEALAEEAQEAVREPLPPPPADIAALLVSFGRMETRLQMLEERHATEMALIAQQEETIAELHAEEEDLEEVAVGEAEESEQCQGADPPAWCRLLAGQKRRT